ncbi:dGTPase [Pedobacter cryoconitis]|uniref:dGTPase n=1 Tax=Pedobacter cryoconitis TaxID=188932 RepID=A0A7W8ZN15_9SPHI|nr:dNTP triphosphohydrolase [Pedobacter cryoconitis]MBB5637036.1 dGTPase [Pedobacter cryoconitis]
MDWKKLLSSERLRKSGTTDIRNEFESDYGRIIYSPALRRMHDKTQVFPLTTDDNIHSRLTHSNEVMSLGYTFGLKLSKSELIQKRTNKSELELLRILPVLLQNVCLVHDIGNAPFGHFGETIVSDYFKNLDKEKHIQFHALDAHQKRDFINYDGNAQGLRVLTKLQYLDNPFGLNLTYATLASYLKYPNFEKINSDEAAELKSQGRTLDKKYIEKSKHGVFVSEKDYFELIMSECGLKVGDRFLRHPLCYLMEAADSIAYICMDMEDGFNKSLFDIEYVKNLFEGNNSLTAVAIKKICDDDLLNSNTKIVNIRIKLIGYFVDLAYKNFEENLDKIENGEFNEELVKLDKDKIYQIIEKISINKIFKSREINYLESTGYAVFTGLLDFYIEFIFHSNQKYCDRAKSLISKSIIDCTIEENLIILCKNKLNETLTKLNDELDLFKLNQQQSEIINKKLTELQGKIDDFNGHKDDYDHLFKKQFTTILDSEEKRKLSSIKQGIMNTVEPCFDDLDNYFKFRIILDFISGMTDQYALNHYQKISGQKIN